jgi:DNA-directed RNA polymerase subunit M/transcription elongation factor TFIIS
MNFCSGCSNMYYLKIESNGESSDKLIHYCRNCGNEEPNTTGENICVSSTNLKENTQQFDSFINEYTKLDPTLPRTNTIKCPNSNCDTNTSKSDDVKREIIYIRYDDLNMKYVYMCSTCDSLWKTNESV